MSTTVPSPTPPGYNQYPTGLPRRIRLAFVILLPALALSPLRADDDAWEAIAEDAAVVVRVENPRKFMEQTAALCELVQKGSGEQVRALMSSLGEKFSTPELAGVDRDLSWWVALYAADDDSPPDTVVILPTTDEKATQPALGKDVLVVKHGKYVAYSTDAVADKMAARLRQKGKAVSALLDRDSRALFDSGELSAFVNVPVLIRVHQAQAEKERESRGGRGNFSRTRRAQSSGSFLDCLLDSLVHAVPDVNSVTVAASVNDDGVALDCLVRLRPGTPTAELLPKSAPDRLEDIGALPPGGVIYAGAVADWARLLPKLAPESHDRRVLRPSAELVAAEAELRELHFESICVSIARLEFEGVADEATIRRTAEVESFRRLSQNLARAKNGGEAATFRWSVQTKPAAERYGASVADITRWRREFRKQAEAGFLPQSWVTRSVYQRGRVIETSGADGEPMRQILAALAAGESPGGGSSDIPRTRKKLHPLADAIVLIDAPRACLKLMDAILRGIAQGLSDGFFFGSPVGGSNIADTASESYSGMSVIGGPDGVRVRAFIPLEQIQSFRQLLQPTNGRRGKLEQNTRGSKTD